MIVRPRHFAFNPEKQRQLDSLQVDPALTQEQKDLVNEIGTDQPFFTDVQSFCFYCAEKLTVPAVVWSGSNGREPGGSAEIWLHPKCAEHLCARLSRDADELKIGKHNANERLLSWKQSHPFRYRSPHDRIRWMDFLTVHELSREFDLPARVVRYRLSAYLKRGELHEGDDYRHEDFKDERHFVWKVNPMTFMRLTNLNPKTLTLIPLPTVNEPSTRVDEPVNESHATVNDTSNKTHRVDNDSDDDRSQHFVHREMIDLLKEQLHIKDGQLKDQAEQSRQVNELNVKLMGATLQQSKKI
jgi:hypothetical protein